MRRLGAAGFPLGQTFRFSSNLMRKLIVLLCFTLVLIPACKRRERAKVQTIEETGSSLASTISMADPKQSAQLLKGFHDVEQNAWRWTMGKFSVVLSPPPASAQRGASLVVHFAVPASVTERLKAVSLSANVNGTALAPETYSKDGEQIYQRDVPAAALKGDSARVDFSLDKFLPAGAVDQRELGIVVTSIGLEAK